MISVVIPTYNEAGHIGRTLEDLYRPGVSAGVAFETVVADASSDRTRALIESFSRQRGVGNLTVVDSPQGRGKQLNRGARAARFPVLLFLHADVTLPDGAFPLVLEALEDERVVGGGFMKRYRERDWRLAGNIAACYLRIRLTREFWGNECIFVRRETFRRLGGFRPWPVMEDIEFSKRLRREGRVAVVRRPVEASARRYLRRGVLRQALTNFRMLFHYKILKRDPAQLERWYRKDLR